MFLGISKIDRMNDSGVCNVNQDLSQFVVLTDWKWINKKRSMTNRSRSRLFTAAAGRVRKESSASPDAKQMSGLF